jgi:hypothetical protein
MKKIPLNPVDIEFLSNQANWRDGFPTFEVIFDIKVDDNSRLADAHENSERDFKLLEDALRSDSLIYEHEGITRQRIEGEPDIDRCGKYILWSSAKWPVAIGAYYGEIFPFRGLMFNPYHIEHLCGCKFYEHFRKPENDYGIEKEKRIVDFFDELINLSRRINAKIPLDCVMMLPEDKPCFAGLKGIIIPSWIANLGKWVPAKNLSGLGELGDAWTCLSF